MKTMGTISGTNLGGISIADTTLGGLRISGTLGNLGVEGSLGGVRRTCLGGVL